MSPSWIIDSWLHNSDKLYNLKHASLLPQGGKVQPFGSKLKASRLELQVILLFVSTFRKDIQNQVF